MYQQCPRMKSNAKTNARKTSGVLAVFLAALPDEPFSDASLETSWFLLELNSPVCSYCGTEPLVICNAFVKCM
jgi:hypothetical protein